MYGVTNLVGFGTHFDDRVLLTWQSMTFSNTSVSTGSHANATIYTKIAGKYIPAASKIKLTLRTAATAETLNNVTVGMRSTAVGADVYDVAAVTPITFNGGTATLAFNSAIAEVVSDTVDFTTTPGTDLVVAFNAGSVASSSPRRSVSNTNLLLSGYGSITYLTSPADIISYVKTGVQEADYAGRTGTPSSTLNNFVYYLKSIEFGS